MGRDATSRPGEDPAVDPDEIGRAAVRLREGGVVACPTETFYALACDPESSVGVARVFALKARRVSETLPLMAASIEQAWAWCGRPDARTERLVTVFWPGPLTVVVDAPAAAVAGVAAPDGSVAIRVPDHAVARALAAALGRPITSTSANVSGDTPAATVDQLRRGIGAEVFVLDGGPTTGGAPSTIVDVRGTVPRLVREGAIAWNRVLESLRG